MSTAESRGVLDFLAGRGTTLPRREGFIKQQLEMIREAAMTPIATHNDGSDRGGKGT